MVNFPEWGDKFEKGKSSLPLFFISKESKIKNV